MQHRQVGFFAANDKQKRFEPAWYSGGDESKTRRFFDLQMHYGSVPLLNKMEKEGKGFCLERGGEQRELGSELLQMFEAENLAVMPMLHRGELRGLMILDYPQKYRLSDGEFSVLEAMASEVALVVENFRLTSERQAYADL